MSRPASSGAASGTESDSLPHVSCLIASQTLATFGVTGIFDGIFPMRSGKVLG